MFSFLKKKALVPAVRASGTLTLRGLRVLLHVAPKLPAAALIDGIDLDIPPGQRLALVGESGSGKSLSAAALMGLIDPPLTWSAQAMQLGTLDLLALNDQQWRDVRGACIALVQQDPLSALSPVFKVGMQIAETIERHSGIRGRAAWQEAVSLMVEVGIADAKRRAHDYPHQLSGGMRQRVAIAMALAAKPAVLLADEPTTALDVTVQAQIMELLLRLSDQRAMAVVFITHDLGLIVDFAHQVAVMYAGKIVETGPAQLLLHQPRHPYTAALLAAQPGLDPTRPKRRLSFVPGTPPLPSQRPTGCAFAPRCALADNSGECLQVRPALRWIEGRQVACHKTEQMTKSNEVSV